MTGHEVVVASLQSTSDLLNMFLGDFTDEELLARSVPGANHVAWQLGHLIHSEVEMIKSQLPDAKMPELPAGFGEMHKGERAKSDTGFLTKAQYLDLFTKVRAATVASVTGANLDQPSTGPMAQFAPKLGDFYLLIANHTMMHAGQFTAVRRKLGKPVLF
jgi:hypothetical protein